MMIHGMELSELSARPESHPAPEHAVLPEAVRFVRRRPDEEDRHDAIDGQVADEFDPAEDCEREIDDAPDRAGGPGVIRDKDLGPVRRRSAGHDSRYDPLGVRGMPSWSMPLITIHDMTPAMGSGSSSLFLHGGLWIEGMANISKRLLRERRRSATGP